MIELVQALKDVVPDFKVEQMERSLENLNKLGLIDYHLQLTNIFGDPELESDGIAEEFLELFYSKVVEALNAFGIVVADEATLANMNTVLETMLVVDDPINADLIDVTMSGDDSPEECIQSLCADISDMSLTDFENTVAAVNDSVINLLREKALDQSAYVVNVEEVARIKMTFKVIMQDRKEGPVRELLKGVQQLPIPFAANLDATMESIDAMESDELIAEEIMAYLVVSGVPEKDIEERGYELVNEYISGGKGAAVSGFIGARCKEVFKHAEV